MTQILNSKRQGLIFEIISAHISEEPQDKKHVIYTLQVRFISGNDDLSPSVIERRYTHFLNLYNALKKDYPTLMTNIFFPKKVLTGNFDNELISARSTGFESLLKHVSTDSRLRNSTALQTFLQNHELTVAKELLEKKEFDSAYYLLENSFKLLNKVFLDRSAIVLLALCRLLACSMSFPGTPNALKWADLALYRFDGVSDTDLLELYVPLLRTCVNIWSQNGRNKDDLEIHIQNLQRRGVKDTKNESLFETVNKVEMKIMNQ